MTEMDEQDTAAIQQLMELEKAEKAGERISMLIGPFTAYSVIGALQLVVRHPQISPDLKAQLRQVWRDLAPAFDGTPLAEAIRRGEHPEWDTY